MEYSKPQKNINLWYILGFTYIILSLVCFTLLAPPFEKPDEYVHFIRALSVSKGVLFCKKERNNLVGIEKKYIDLPKMLIALKDNSGDKLVISKYVSAIFKQNGSKNNFNFDLDPLCSFPFISYIPHASILKLLSYFNISGLLSFFIGRIFITILSFFWFLLLFKKIYKDFRPMLLFIFGLPMSLYQVSSYSYDAMHIMFGLTFFTFFIRIFVKKVIIASDQILLFISLIFLTTAKRIGYEFFLFFIFLLPVHKLARSKFLYVIKISFFLLLFALINFFFKQAALTDFQQPFHSPLVNPQRQISFILYHPIDFLHMLLSTTSQKLDFYIQGVIGIFGWLEYGLDPVSYLLVGFLFLYIIYLTKISNILKLSIAKLFFLLGILLLSYIYIVTSSYLFWTGVGESVADGVQGRYFLVLIPFAFFSILQLKSYRFVHNTIISFSFIYILINAFKVIITSYFK